MELCKEHIEYLNNQEKHILRLTICLFFFLHFTRLNTVDASFTFVHLFDCVEPRACQLIQSFCIDSTQNPANQNLISALLCRKCITLSSNLSRSPEGHEYMLYTHSQFFCLLISFRISHKCPFPQTIILQNLPTSCLQFGVQNKTKSVIF